MGRQNKKIRKTSTDRVVVEFEITPTEERIMRRLLTQIDLGEAEAIGIDPLDMALSGESLEEAYEEMAYLFSYIKYSYEQKQKD